VEIAPSVTRLIEELGKLPGIGPKTAQRLTFYILRSPREAVQRLAAALLDVKERTRTCAQCFFIAEGDRCPICQSPKRERTTVCVVEEALDVVAIERAGDYHGLYHVLGGALSPLDGIGPDELRIRELQRRVQEAGIAEVIVATDPDVEGEATAAYLAQVLQPTGARVTRLAHGLPAGAELEYADELTLSRAFAGRRSI
jgi:recombination protein RecR